MSSGGALTRTASHAGSWYEDDEETLGSELTGWLSAASIDSKLSPSVRAIISPHAGYRYSGATAAYGFKHMVPNNIRRVFVLGPSHHYHTKRCELTACQLYSTPVGDIQIDHDVIRSLKSSSAFDVMAKGTDEDEHSIEMQLPYIAHVMKGTSFTLIPILVGSLSASAADQYGKILAPYLADPHSFFVISSDFCHWGSRFSYRYYDKSAGHVWQSIEKLDRAGMDTIESQSASSFSSYLDKYNNTICGRHPISVLLNCIGTIRDVVLHTKFIHYTQSSQCFNDKDSSVSYASAIVTVDSKKKDPAKAPVANCSSVPVQ